MSNGSGRTNVGDVTSPRWVGGVNGVPDRRLAEVTAERDALRAQLDGMTTQWAVQDTLLTFIYEQESEEYARSLTVSRRTERSRLVKRLVGPWAAVEDAEGVSDGQQ